MKIKIDVEEERLSLKCGMGIRRAHDFSCRELGKEGYTY